MLRAVVLGIISLLLLATGPMTFAQGAIRFKSLEEARQANLYRITCSDPQNQIQAHIFIEIYQKKLSELKILTIANAESLMVVNFSAKDLSGFKMEESKNTLRIFGERPGTYFTEELDFNLSEKDQTFKATFYYNDHDGMIVDRKSMECGLVNYILSPSQ